MRITATVLYVLEELCVFQTMNMYTYLLSGSYSQKALLVRVLIINHKF